MENVNGNALRGDDLAEHVRATYERTRELVTNLEALLLDEERVFQELSEEAGKSKARRDHLKRALEHLTGDTAKYRQKSAAKSTKRKSDNQWQVSEERITAVLEQLKTEPDPITPTQLSAKMDGVSHETVAKAIEALRERELIRFTGTTRGGGKNYVVMPEVLTDAA